MDSRDLSELTSLKEYQESLIRSVLQTLLDKGQTCVTTEKCGTDKDIILSSAQKRPGLCGLINVGNTCYMNSVVQCLSHCSPVTQYFLNESHMTDVVSLQKPLGEITVSFVRLLKKLWSGKFMNVLPSTFLARVMEDSSDEFALGEQHDAQDFIVYILNTLHTELNSAFVKPSTSLTVFEERSDEKAKRSWVDFKATNDSVIADNFYGLLKSTVICSDCNEVSDKFDPYLVLSLPIPSIKNKNVKVRHVPYSQNTPITDYVVSVPHNATVKELFIKLTKFISVPIERMILSEVYSHRCHKFYNLDDQLSHINDNCILTLFDAPIEMTCNTLCESHIVLPVALWEVSGEGVYNKNSELFGNPFLIFMPSTTITYQELYNLIVARMTRYLKIHQEMQSKTSEEKEMQVDMFSFKLFVGDNINYLDTRELTDESIIIFNEHLYHESIAVQWTTETRCLWYNEVTPLYHDTTESLKLTLEDCLHYFTKTEKLETWMCCNCKKYTSASIKYDISTLPAVLIFNLKRVVYEDGHHRKISDFIDFPITNFHINKYACLPGQEPIIYDLISICNHYGSANAGHYTTFAKYNIDQNWYSFDDKAVLPLQEHEIVSDAAYMLFYLHRGEQSSELPTSFVSASSSETSATSLIDAVYADLSTLRTEPPFKSASEEALEVDLLATASTEMILSDSSEGSVGSRDNSEYTEL